MEFRLSASFYQVTNFQLKLQISELFDPEAASVDKQAVIRYLTVTAISLKTLNLNIFFIFGRTGTVNLLKEPD